MEAVFVESERGGGGCVFRGAVSPSVVDEILSAVDCVERESAGGGVVSLDAQVGWTGSKAYSAQQVALMSPLSLVYAE